MLSIKNWSFTVSRDDIDKKIHELTKKCNRQVGGYAIDKQSAYQNGFIDGLREALTFIYADSEDFICDVCNSKITNFESDLFHFSGILHGKFNGHLHLCAKCKDEIMPQIFNFDEFTNMPNNI